LRFYQTICLCLAKDGTVRHVLAIIWNALCKAEDYAHTKASNIGVRIGISGLPEPA
jgi:glyoxylate carboligase